MRSDLAPQPKILHQNDAARVRNWVRHIRAGRMQPLQSLEFAADPHAELHFDALLGAAGDGAVGPRIERGASLLVDAIVLEITLAPRAIVLRRQQTSLQSRMGLAAE